MAFSELKPFPRRGQLASWHHTNFVVVKKEWKKKEKKRQTFKQQKQQQQLQVWQSQMEEARDRGEEGERGGREREKEMWGGKGREEGIKACNNNISYSLCHYTAGLKSPSIHCTRK